MKLRPMRGVDIDRIHRIWTTFQVGRFVVRQRPRPDNPGWLVYIIFLKEREIGRSFSVPDADCCEWLLAHPDGQYAPPAVNKPWDYGHRPIAAKRKHGRPKKAETLAREAREIEEALT